MLYDTHCHLNAEELLPELNLWIQKATQVGVHHMNVIGWDERSSMKAIELSQQYPQCHAVIGVHPVNDALENIRQLDFIKRYAKTNKIVAIGEIGLDYYWKKDPLDHQRQQTLFVQQLNLANQLQLPVVVHCRDAYEDVLRILELNRPQYGGVMHCYVGPTPLIPSFIKCGMHLSLGGPITYKKNDHLRTMIASIPLERLLIETDAPYLSPEPYRGKTNHPANVIETFNTIVKHRTESAEMIHTTIYENSLSLFHVKKYE